MECVGATWMIPPIQKIKEASAIDHRRPNFLVNGQAKKQEKKARSRTQGQQAARTAWGRDQDMPPACRRLVEFEAISARSASEYRNDCLNESRVRIPPIMPVSYAKRKDPTQQTDTRNVARRRPSSLPITTDETADQSEYASCWYLQY